MSTEPESLGRTQYDTEVYVSAYVGPLRADNGVRTRVQLRFIDPLYKNDLLVSLSAEQAVIIHEWLAANMPLVPD